jgi:hypothetical protein
MNPGPPMPETAKDVPAAGPTRYPPGSFSRALEGRLESPLRGAWRACVWQLQGAPARSRHAVTGEARVADGMDHGR